MTIDDIFVRVEVCKRQRRRRRRSRIRALPFFYVNKIAFFFLFVFFQNSNGCADKMNNARSFMINTHILLLFRLITFAV